MSVTDMDVLWSKVVLWGHDRNLIYGSTPQAQMLKLTEEIGELAAAVARNDKEKLKDSVGDALVVLTLIAIQNKLSLGECYEAAYQEIKDRKGKMVEGVFVKDE